MRIFLIKKYIHIRSLFIADKSLRKRYRKIKFAVIVNKLLEKYKFGVSYSVFDGEELLEASIRQIRNSVDYINVVWQSRSWYNTPADENLYPLLKKLLDDGLIDELIEYTPDFTYVPGKNERLKRNLGLKYAKIAKVQYFMTMDADEFYMSEEFAAAKKEIVSQGITHAFCGITRYGFSPDELAVVHGGNVQFLSKLRYCSSLKHNKKIITVIDPTRQLNHYLFAKYFYLSKITMHHMGSIRKDLHKRYKNSSNTAFQDEAKIQKHNKFITENSIKYKDVFNLKHIIGKFVENDLSQE